MLSRISALRGLKSLKPSATGSSSVVSRRWESNVPSSGSKGSSTTPYDGPVLKAWEQHPDVTEYPLSDGSRNLMIGHQFIAHRPFEEGSEPFRRGWNRGLRFMIPFWLLMAYIADTKFQVRPYPWWPFGIARLTQFDKENYLNYKTDPSHYYQSYDDTLEDPNEEEEEEEEEED